MSRILDLGYFRCPVSVWQTKSLRKNNHLMQLTEKYIKKEQLLIRTYWNEDRPGAPVDL